MKTIFVFLLTICAFAFSAKAQVPTYAAQTLTIPTVAAGQTSNSVAAVIDCRKQQNVAISWLTTGTNVSFNMSKSIDGSVWLTNAYTVVGMSNAFPTITNINVGGVGFLRVDSVTSTGTTIATNTVSYGVKISAP